MNWVIQLTMASVAVLVATAGQVQAGMIVDGDFSSSQWSFGSYGENGGSATVTREATGGNPGARLNITTETIRNTLPGDLGAGLAIKEDYVTTSVLSGSAFTLSLDFKSGPGAFGQGQGILLLVEQAGAIYGRGLGTTGYIDQLLWRPLSFSSTFDATSFTLLSGTGSGPNFDGGVATKFGFAARNSRSGTLTQFYDNFQLESTAISPVPEPASMALFGLGSLGIGVIARRRKKQLAA